jgi:hypothetical protein
MCVQLKMVSGQALALNSLGINKFMSGDLQLANEMFQVKGLQRTRTRTRTRTRAP